MNKVCIIGLDALEYNLVEKFDLDVLKQNEYGKVDLSTAIGKTKNCPLSPVVWTSFLTGLPENEHNISGFDWSFSPINIIYKIPTPGWGLENRLLKRLGFDKDFPDEIEENTFLDELGSEGVGVNVPIKDFSFHDADFGHIGEFNSQSLVEKKRKLISNSKKVFNRAIKNINGNWKVFFTYFYWIDGIQHNFYMNGEILKEEYQRACDYVGKIKEKLDDDTLVLIVSDHGNQLEKGNGNHSDHAFYSLSEERGLNNPKITDFYDFIMDEIDMPTGEDKKNIKKTLRKLGYI